jgi:hypothetical protein
MVAATLYYCSYEAITALSCQDTPPKRPHPPNATWTPQWGILQPLIGKHHKRFQLDKLLPSFYPGADREPFPFVSTHPVHLPLGVGSQR